VLRQSANDRVTVVGAGVTCVRSAEGADESSRLRVPRFRVIDLYSVAPVDQAALIAAGRATGGTIITVEDHYAAGGTRRRRVGSGVRNRRHSRLSPGRARDPAKRQARRTASTGSGISAKHIAAKVLEVLGVPEVPEVPGVPGVPKVPEVQGAR
jgi:transketolase C-terminal domain/subunit